ncbi:MAG: hypothetical protein HWD86_02365 [Kangiellaceae bacterium]|nr:hypothetical protein [Kangiellaceae bacterium]
MKLNKLLNGLKAILMITSLAIAFNSNANQGLLEKAKLALAAKQLDKAEEYIEKLLEHSPDEPNHLFMAGRIAGAQAQEASIFSKLGYARDVKKYFEQALSIDPYHKPSIIGLIRFHEQAPVMAGGEKESIPALIEQLRKVDKKTAFTMQSGKLLDNKEFELLEKRYQEALNQQDSSNSEQFKYDFAMQLSKYGYYSKALDMILTIDLSKPELIADFAAMRLYQVAKLAAESRRELDLGVESIQQYAELSAEDKTIPDDWVEFRLLQLQFLSGNSSVNKQTINALKAKTEEKSLKDKISSFLKEVKL